ncbi:MAG: VCBS repeat-containing protein [Candidatus Aenigmarchaeota archaeon]|nr:VCBS repeat-containing protein [Candidatus Aenigmarchaeota archaeon]
MKFTPLIFFLTIFLLTSTTVSAQYLNENVSWESNLTAIYYSSLALGDIDNNGYLDLLTIGKSENGILTQIYTNNGTNFQENNTWKVNLTNVHYGSIALGDIDNDGDLDLALSGCSSGGGYVSPCDDNKQETFIYINNGITFLENLTWEQNLEKVWRSSITFADINNDGNLDLLLTGQTNTGRVSKIYLNNKTSFIENLNWQNNLTNVDSGSIAIIDINNDNYLDLILTGENSDFQKITKTYINNGTSFIENLTWEQNLINVDDSSIIPGDIDNDGDLDLSIIGCCDLHRTYNNTGTTFQEIQKDITDFVGLFSGSQVFGDYNNDGYLDLITTGRESYTALYANLGNGSFTNYWNRPEQQLSPLEYSSVVFGDVDNDMDLDLILTGWGNPGDWYQKRVYINNITSTNTLPFSPSSNFNHTFNFSTGKLSLEWNNGSDTETPTLGLYYNLRVGTCSGCHDVVSGVYGGSSNPTAGYFGNMMQRKSITLNRPDLENKTVYWAVQTIDTGLAKSAWSTEQVFEITQACTENWSYGTWSSCVNNQQTRTATDLNDCGTTVNKSATTQSCTSYTPPSGGGTYVPPATPKNATNTTNNTGSSGTNTANTSGNESSGANTGLDVNGSGQSVKTCVPFDVKCEGGNLMECVSSGEWTVKQICEFGCADGECKKGNDFYGNLQYLLLVFAGVIVVGAGVFIGFRRFFGSKTPVSA